MVFEILEKWYKNFVSLWRKADAAHSFCFYNNLFVFISRAATVGPIGLTVVALALRAYFITSR